MTILERLENGGFSRNMPLSSAEVEELLQTPLHSESFYRLLSAAERLSRRKSETGRGLSPAKAWEMLAKAHWYDGSEAVPCRS